MVVCPLGKQVQDQGRSVCPPTLPKGLQGLRASLSKNKYTEPEISHPSPLASPQYLVAVKEACDWRVPTFDSI